MGLELQGRREEAPSSGRMGVWELINAYTVSSLIQSRAENSAGTISALTRGWPWQHSAKGVGLREALLSSFSS